MTSSTCAASAMTSCSSVLISIGTPGSVVGCMISPSGLRGGLPWRRVQDDGDLVFDGLNLFVERRCHLLDRQLWDDATLVGLDRVFRRLASDRSEVLIDMLDQHQEDRFA